MFSTDSFFSIFSKPPSPTIVPSASVLVFFSNSASLANSSWSCCCDTSGRPCSPNFRLLANSRSIYSSLHTYKVNKGAEARIGSEETNILLSVILITLFCFVVNVSSSEANTSSSRFFFAAPILIASADISVPCCRVLMRRNSFASRTLSLQHSFAN